MKPFFLFALALLSFQSLYSQETNCSNRLKYSQKKRQLEKTDPRASAAYYIIENYYKLRCECDSGRLSVKSSSSFPDPRKRTVTLINSFASDLNAYYGTKYGTLPKVTSCKPSTSKYQNTSTYKSATKKEYYFGNHYACNDPISIRVHNNRTVHRLYPKSELKLSLPYNQLNVTITNGCTNKQTNTLIAPGGTLFASWPKAKGNYVSRFVIYKNSNNYTRYKKKHTVKLYNKNKHLDKSFTVNGIQYTLKKNHKTTFTATSYFKPVLYDKKAWKKIALDNNSGYHWENSKNKWKWVRRSN